MIADPAFLYKMLLESAATLGCSFWWELKNRKDRLSVSSFYGRRVASAVPSYLLFFCLLDSGLNKNGI